MQPLQQIAELIYKHITNELTEEERKELERWTHQSDENQYFFSEVSDAVRVLKESTARQEELKAVNVVQAWEKLHSMGLPEIKTEDPPRATVIRFHWRKIAIAASILLCITAAVWVLFPAAKNRAPVVVQNKVTNDARPNTKVAILTLDDGKQINLDSLKNGVLAQQGNISVVRDKNGVIRYTYDGKQKSGTILYNTVSVPKGGDVVYLLLEDGSRVWLNAASSIRYPVVFDDNERKVEITGEAYFEVAKSLSAKKRFIVSKGNMNVTVLGTKFNVNTYDNEESIKVTLLEGSVKVEEEAAGKKYEKTIKPGQQAVLNGSIISVLDDVDIKQVMAWKDGKFVFKNTNIQLIMRQMERWYDLEPTRYESSAVRQWEFNGEISRYNNASKLLELLEETGSIKFKIEGKKIVVSQQ
jgi:transmembrane sensor